MHRIPHGKDQTPGGDRPVVYLQHALITSSALWSFGPPKKSLAYILADQVKHSFKVVEKVVPNTIKIVVTHYCMDYLNDFPPFSNEWTLLMRPVIYNQSNIFVALRLLASHCIQNIWETITFLTQDLYLCFIFLMEI